MTSSAIPSAKYSCSGSPLMFVNGSTAMETRSVGNGGSTGAAVGTWRRPLPIRHAQLVRDRLRARVRLDVQLALEQRDGVLVVLQRVGLATRAGERAQGEPVRVFAQIVDRDRALRGFERRIEIASLQLLVAQAHHRVEREILEPLPLGLHPLDPRLVGDDQVGEERPLVDPHRLARAPSCRRRARAPRTGRRRRQPRLARGTPSLLR